MIPSRLIVSRMFLIDATISVPTIISYNLLRLEICLNIFLDYYLLNQMKLTIVIFGRYYTTITTRSNSSSFQWLGLIYWNIILKIFIFKNFTEFLGTVEWTINMYESFYSSLNNLFLLILTFLFLLHFKKYSKWKLYKATKQKPTKAK